MDAKVCGRALGVSVAGLLLAAAVGCSSNVEKVGSSKARGTAQSAQTMEKPAGGSPESGAPSQSGSPSANGPVVTMNGLTWDVASGLKSEAPASTMRIAQYRIPSGKDGVKDGEMAVFYFGPGSGGGTQANLERWGGQFKQSDGSDPMGKAKIDHLTSKGGLKVTTIALAGRYESSGMGGGPSYDEAGWKLFGAVVEGQGGPWFFKAVGPESVIDGWQPKLVEMCKGLRAGS